MLKFINDLLTYVNVQDLRLLYTDTGENHFFYKNKKNILDSFHFALAEELDDLVKPELKEKWEKEIKPRTFVLDQTSVVQQRTPGLWKEEYSIRDGSAILRVHN